jgi:uncharacterized repeat protein (TIGR04076 family)
LGYTVYNLLNAVNSLRSSDTKEIKEARDGLCIVDNCTKPEGLCDSAWQTMLPFIKGLSEGGGNFFDGWMKNPHSAMLSCNDGFRPVSFYIETIE